MTFQGSVGWEQTALPAAHTAMATRPGGFLNGSQSAIWDAPVKRFKVHKPGENRRRTPTRSASAVDARPSGFLNASQNDIWSQPGHASYSSLNGSASSIPSSLSSTTAATAATAATTPAPVKEKPLYSDGLVLSPESHRSPNQRQRRVVTRSVSADACSLEGLAASFGSGRPEKHNQDETDDDQDSAQGEERSVPNNPTKPGANHRCKNRPPAPRSMVRRTKSAQLLLTGDNNGGNAAEDYSSVRGCLKNVPQRKAKPTMASKVAEITWKTIQKEKEPTKKASKAKGQSNQLKKKREKAAIRIQTAARRMIAQVKRRNLAKVRELQQRLDGMQALTQSDKEKIAADVKKKIKTLREKAQAKMYARAKQGEQAQDHQKLIAYLKKDNSEIRARNTKIEVNMRNLQTNNTRLSKNNQSGEDYHKRLTQHHEKVVLDNQKLTKSLNEIRKQVEDVEDELVEKSRVSAVEHIVRCRYQETIDNLVERVNQTDRKALKREVSGHVAQLRSSQKAWSALSPQRNKASFQIKRFVPDDDDDDDSCSESELDDKTSIDKLPFGNSSQSLNMSSSDDDTSDSSATSYRKDRSKGKKSGPNKTTSKGATATKKNGKKKKKIVKKKQKLRTKRKSNADDSSSSSSSDSSHDRKKRTQQRRKASPRVTLKKSNKVTHI